MPDFELFPFLGISVSIVYNLEGDFSSLVFSRDVLVDIFLGNIKKWNDRRILELNPGMVELDEFISIVTNDSELEGSTAVITGAFAKWSDEWRERYGASVNIFPTENIDKGKIFQAKDDRAILPLIKEVKYSIGYVSSAIVSELNYVIKTAKIINKAGRALTGRTETIKASMRNIEFNENRYAYIQDSDEEDAYPITGLYYLGLLTENTPVENCYEFQQAIFTSIYLMQYKLFESVCEDYGQSVLPYELRVENIERLLRIKCNGTLIGESSYGVFLGGPDPNALVATDFTYIPLNNTHSEEEEDYEQEGYFPIHGIENLPNYPELKTFSKRPNQEIDPYYDSIGDTITQTSEITTFDFPEYTISYSDIVELFGNDSNIDVFKNSNDSNRSMKGVNLFQLGCMILISFGFLQLSSSSSRIMSSFMFIMIICVSLYCIGISNGVEARISSESSSEASSATLHFVGLFQLTGRDSLSDSTSETNFARLAIQDLEYEGEQLVDREGKRNFDFDIEIKNTENIPSKAFSSLLQVATGNFFGIIGTENDLVTRQAGALSNLLRIPFITHANNKIDYVEDYEYFSSVIPIETREARALAALIKFYGWGNYGDISVIGQPNEKSTALFEEFIESAAALDLDINDPRVFYEKVESPIEFLYNIRNSNARVLVFFVDIPTMQSLLYAGDILDMINENYVWICGSLCGNDNLVLEPSTVPGEEWKFIPNPKLQQLANGLITVGLPSGHGHLFDDFMDRYLKLNPYEYFGAGPDYSIYAPYAYDAVKLIVLGYRNLLLNETLEETPENYLYSLRNTVFEGLTGKVELAGTPERRPEYFFKNYYNNNFYTVGTWLSPPTNYHESVVFYDEIFDYGVTMKYDIYFHNNSTDLPDLDIRNSFDYWSCSAREIKTDESGRSIRLDEPTPDASNIASFYECDGYVDCYNMSDEFNCSFSIPIAMIIFGIIILLILIFIFFCFISIFLFTFIIKTDVFITAGPEFLMVLCIFCFFGVGSFLAWFGQPSTVSCNFQLWLLSTCLVFVVSTLLVKVFRVFYCFYLNFMKKIPPPLYVLIIFVLTLPVLFILLLWTIIATIEADIEDVNGHYHYVCSSSGFAGQIAGYVFFGVMCFYFLLLFLITIILQFFVRHVIVPFHENRHVSTSIYNLLIVCIVGITIYFILDEEQNTAQWAVTGVLIIYGFTSTILIHFIPKFFHITQSIFKKRPLHNKKNKDNSDKSTSSENNSQNDIFE
eukprot:TRINITY_DN423_c0_g2_i7.p1 TRINITY_DN423_c0_g2~~TRINITY_DN423_c0_g2_i7.p1  ORF type:complete len:1235 (+),score=362.09 TRINITY_DN423_c0_g2_i7:623-4327(+)